MRYLSAFFFGCHVFGGSVVIFAIIGAMTAEKGKNFHQLSGRLYLIGMLLALISAIFIGYLKSNPLVILLALFTLYLIISGYRAARYSNKETSILDQAMAYGCIIMGFIMISYGSSLSHHEFNLIILYSFFGMIVSAIGVKDSYIFRKKQLNYSQKISLHLTNMLASGIASLTAVCIIVIRSNPEWLSWILPTFAITPLIIYWNYWVKKYPLEKKIKGQK